MTLDITTTKTFLVIINNIANHLFIKAIYYKFLKTFGKSDMTVIRESAKSRKRYIKFVEKN